MYLVTGATGFIGSALIKRMNKIGIHPRGVVRERAERSLEGCSDTFFANLEQCVDWAAPLHGISVVIHTAARVHVMKEAAKDPLSKFRQINVDGTLELARQASLSGVKRFIFISSIKVNGEKTRPGHPFTERDAAKPDDPYGISKFEAEEGLKQIARQTGMEVVIFRPVLVYGPGVKGNFLSMITWLKKGFPLPFGSIQNLRSFLAIDNLIDIIMISLHHPSAANETFLVSDGDDLSTTQLLKYTAMAIGVRPILVSIPQFLLYGAFRFFGGMGLADRLCANLQVDITKAQRVLGWSPPISIADGIKKAVSSFISIRGSR